MEASHAKRRQAVRPQRRGPRQYRRSGARQPAGRGPGPDHAVLHQRPGIDARSLPDDQHRQHVGQCRPQPVPPDHRQAAAPARPHRPGHSGSRSAAAAARQDEEAARGHALRLQGARRPCRDHVSVGQQAPDPRTAGSFGRMQLGMPYVEFDVPAGSAKAIADFYRKVFETPASVDETGDMPAARVSVGPSQELVFRETKSKLAAYDGHHIQVYVANFSRPHKRLLERKLVTEESNQYQYRFERHHRSRERQAPVPDRARGALHDPSALCAAAGQPQPGPDQPQLRAGPRRLGGRADGRRRWTIRAWPCASGGSRR